MFAKNCLSIILILLSGAISAQSNNEVSLTEYLKEKKDTDTVYHKGVQSGINYFVYLNKEILPKYWTLKKDVLNKILAEDYKILTHLNSAYNLQIKSHLDEMKSTQTRVWKNLVPNSWLYNVLVFETFSVYPDTYALLINPTVISRNVNNIDRVFIDQLYKKYQKILEADLQSIQQFKKVRELAMTANEFVLPFQNLGNADDYRERCDLIDFMLWSIK